jgi:hypothetical protein
VCDSDDTDDTDEHITETCLALLRINCGAKFSVCEIEVEGEHELIDYYEGDDAPIHIKQV